MTELMRFAGPVRSARDLSPLALTLRGVSAAGEPTTIQTPGTTMAGLDCAEVSLAAYLALHGNYGMPFAPYTDEEEGHLRAEASRRMEAGAPKLPRTGPAARPIPAQHFS